MREIGEWVLSWAREVIGIEVGTAGISRAFSVFVGTWTSTGIGSVVFW